MLTLPSCAPYRVSISTGSSIVDGLFCKHLTEFLSIRQESMSTSLKNVHCTHKTGFATFFYYFGVYHIAENFPFFLQLVKVIWKTAANPGETFTQSCAEKYEVFCTLQHEFDLV